jgi:hypothetical protein
LTNRRPFNFGIRFAKNSSNFFNKKFFIRAASRLLFKFLLASPNFAARFVQNDFAKPVPKAAAARKHSPTKRETPVKYGENREKRRKLFLEMRLKRFRITNLAVAIFYNPEL